MEVLSQNQTFLAPDLHKEKSTLNVAPCCDAEFICHRFKDVHVLLLAAPSNPGQIVINFSAARAEHSNCVISIFFSAAHVVCKLRLNTWRGKKKKSRREKKRRRTLICFHCRVHTSEQTVQICSQGNLWGGSFPHVLIKFCGFHQDIPSVGVSAPWNLDDQGRKVCNPPKVNKGRRTALLPTQIWSLN